MDLTMKELADELGVSKQTVYKRATGKLKQELAPNPERSKVHTYPKTKQTGAHPFLIHQKHTEQIRNKYGAAQTNPLQIQFPYKFCLTLIHPIYNPHTKQTKVMLRSTPYQIRISYSPILLTQASHTEHMLY